MSMPQTSRRSVVDELARRLSEGVRDSRFMPGQRLVEAELTRELGVSRGSLREAFRRLASDGLIEITPHKGAMVRRLTFTEAIELFQVRIELEALAARLAASVMADHLARAAFLAAIEPIRRQVPRLSADAYIEENRAFHDAILAGSGNAQLIGISRRFQLPLILSQVRAAISLEAMAASVAEHRGIAEAILSGNEEKATGAVRQHLTRAMALLEAVPKSCFAEIR
ncbi:MAG: GntR family transcriptional regulator [Cucumibacter sp.]